MLRGIVMGYIYMVTNCINGHKYIGQTKCDDIATRWKAHKTMNKSSIGQYLLNAYHKYGISNFSFKIICICFNEDCDRYEEEYIKKYNTLMPNGYNLKAGGRTSLHSQHTKELIRRKLKERITDDIREQIRNRFKDIPLQPYHKEKLRQAQYDYWNDLSIDEYNKICESRKGRAQTNNICNALKMGPEKRKRGVIKLDINHNKMCEYSSLSDAARCNDISYVSISKVCRKIDKYNTAGGFVWEFI